MLMQSKQIIYININICDTAEIMAIRQYLRIKVYEFGVYMESVVLILFPLCIGI